MAEPHSTSAEGCCWLGLCLEEQSASDGVKAWLAGMFGSWARSSCATPSTALAFLFIIFLWLHHILGEAWKCLNKVKFLKSELNQPEPKPAGGHESTSPEFWDELLFAACHGVGLSQPGSHTRQTLAHARDSSAAAGEPQGVSHGAVCFSLRYAPLI